MDKSSNVAISRATTVHKDFFLNYFHITIKNDRAILRTAWHQQYIKSVSEANKAFNMQVTDKASKLLQVDAPVKQAYEPFKSEVSLDNKITFVLCC